MESSEFTVICIDEEATWEEIHRGNETDGIPPKLIPENLNV